MKIYNKTWMMLFMLSIILFAACKKDNTIINTNISKVTELFYPEANKYIKLQPSTQAVVNFEWGQARAEDGTLVMYEVAFDKATGDFSKPIYRIAADKNGIANSLALSHKVLNKIANTAGIDPSAYGTLKWTVIASKGLNEKIADSSRTIVVERPAGLEVPSNVYLTGDATEGGATLANALPLKLNDGIYEIFTKLKSGKFYFVDRKEGTPVTYSFQGSKLQEGGEDTQTSEKIYRIRLDFDNAFAEVTEITDAGIFASAWNKLIGKLTYNGNGLWSAQDIAINYYDFGSWKDDRFKFEFATKDASGTDNKEYYGSMNSSNSTPPDANTPASYFKLVPVDNSQWDFTYKYPTGADGKKGDFEVKFSTNADYSYKLTIK